MTTARYPVHKLIQDLMRDPVGAEAFREDAEPFFASYRLTDEEKALLRDGSRDAMHRLGVHPNLQMKYGRIRRQPPPPGSGPPGWGPLTAYVDQLLER